MKYQYISALVTTHQSPRIPIMRVCHISIITTDKIDCYIYFIHNNLIYQKYQYVKSKHQFIGNIYVYISVPLFMEFKSLVMYFILTRRVF